MVLPFLFSCLFCLQGSSSPVQNGLARSSPKENGDVNSHAKKEPVSPRSGRSSASSTPTTSGKKGSDDKAATPTTNGSGGPLKPGLNGPGFGLPGLPPGVPIPPGAPFSAENGYRPPFDPHTALRPPLGGKP